ncbi:nucleoside phosphorylase domain-containing protein [Glomus cerebriforme]|uniref:Nucleoside phosphorylase domain-containing protein n=1 Tax=Glomus cerebriforme TaxID=658196 RepID=A0A397T2F2_9GLOM|nr:nucleoside phosphorylase domain-containing protein [Glomus cerebriforme]
MKLYFVLKNFLRTKIEENKSKIENANSPVTGEGRVYHVGVKRGEVANRIITVGDPKRAEEFAKWLDKDTPIFRIKSHRGFLTLTGKYKGVPVSIAGIGMGMSMMDFFVREIRKVVDGQLSIIRFGSCGTIGEAKVGDMIVQNSAFAVTRNYNYSCFFDENVTPSSEEKPYNFTRIFFADIDLCKKIESQLVKSFGKEHVFTGLNATCDSFYSSQGRKEDNFRDYNSDLIPNTHTGTISKTYPGTISIEMETFMLFHLAKSSKDHSIKAASAAMVFADRITNEFISPEKIEELQKVGGKAILNALVEIELNEVHPDNENCVWNRKNKFLIL